MARLDGLHLGYFPRSLRSGVVRAIFRADPSASVEMRSMHPGMAHPPIAIRRKYRLKKSGTAGRWIRSGSAALCPQKEVSKVTCSEPKGSHAHSVQSMRKALTGLIEAARRAGMIPAMAAASVSTPMATAITGALTLVIS